VRLFLAITPPPAAIGELDLAVAPLRAARPELRWAGTDAWHVTLAFLGEVSDNVLPELETRLARAAGRHEAQPLAVRGGGAFPNAGRARVLWAGLQADTAALARLAASVAAGARRAGAPPPDEGRRYRPHLTLARCREPADIRDVVAALADFAGTGWTAGQVELIRSHLGGQPRYEQLAGWPLRTAG
jgi:RNA 2',3'-cyclic 3'-phosphodiesterase